MPLRTSCCHWYRESAVNRGSNKECVLLSFVSGLSRCLLQQTLPHFPDLATSCIFISNDSKRFLSAKLLTSVIGKLLYIYLRMCVIWILGQSVAMKGKGGLQGCKGEKRRV